jgi:hypothetical protein
MKKFKFLNRKSYVLLDIHLYRHQTIKFLFFFMLRIENQKVFSKEKKIIQVFIIKKE